MSTKLMADPVDEAHWLWNTYSGLAHTYSWPRTLWSTNNDPRVPGDYAMDLQLVATCTQIALTAHLDRVAPGSANTATPVNLTTQPKPPTTT